MPSHSRTDSRGSSLEMPDLASGQAVASRSDSRLVLLVSGQADLLRNEALAIAADLDWRSVDLNRDLTQRLLPHTASERRDLAWDAFEEVVGDPSDGVVLISTDILFEPSLGYRPYEAIRRLARRGPVIAAWFGTVEGAFIIRAQPGHPEYVKARLDVPYLNVKGKKGAGA